MSSPHLSRDRKGDYLISRVTHKASTPTNSFMSARSSDQYPIASSGFHDDEAEASEFGDQEPQQVEEWTTRDGSFSSTTAIPLQTLKPSTASERPNRTPSPRVSRAFQSLTAWPNTRSWWPIEVLCWIFSLAFFGAIITVLVLFNNRSLPDWPYGITPNALVSVFATIQSALLAIPVSAGMGQLKWTWFRRPRRLNMFEAIEGAGRDPIAAVTLLLRRQGGWLSAIGALLTISMLAIGPFIQQIMVFESEDVEVGKASIPVARSYGLADNNSLRSRPEVGMLAAIFRGGLSPQSISVSVAPSCATGNCTWPSYSSLAVCSECANITKQLKVDTIAEDIYFTYQTYSLPNGVGLYNVEVERGQQSAVPRMNATTSYGQCISACNVTYDPTEPKESETSIYTMAFPNRGTVLVDSFVITSQPLAFECILRFCVQTYHANVTNGALSETVIARRGNNGTTVMTPKTFATWRTGGTETYLSPSNNETFTVGNSSILQLIDWFNTTFTGEAWGSPEYDDYFSDSDVAASLNQSSENLPSVFDNMARSMTAELRSDGGVSELSSVVGHAFHTVIHVHVRWPWIILPAILEVLVLVFLALVVRNSRNRGIRPYKSGLLPVLFHGLEERARGNMPALDQIDEMVDSAETLNVKLENFEGMGWRLVPAE